MRERETEKENEEEEKKEKEEKEEEELAYEERGEGKIVCANERNGGSPSSPSEKDSHADVSRKMKDFIISVSFSLFLSLFLSFFLSLSLHRLFISFLVPCLFIVDASNQLIG